MTSNSLWQTRILAVLWLLHIPILMRSIVENTARLLLQNVRGDRANSMSGLALVLMVAALILELGEIGSFNKGNLKPVFYLCSQGLKFAIWTWYWYPIVGISIHYKLGTSYWFSALAEWSTFLAGLIYAVYTFYKHKSRQRIFLLSRPHEDFYLNVDGRDLASPYKLPVLINTTHHLRADKSLVVTLIQWLYLHSTRRDHVSLGMLKSAIFALKYTIVSIPILVCAPFFSYLPHELSNHPLMNLNPARDDWDYPLPYMSRHGDYTDTPNLASDSERIGDHANFSDALSLHSVDQQSHAQTSRSAARQQRPVSSTRLLGPRYLCFLTEPDTKDTKSSYRVRSVNDWLAQHNSSALPDYIFISYTRRQFFTEDVSKQGTASRLDQARKMAARRDRSTLINYGVTAAKRAGVPAFWVDFECVQPEDEFDEAADMDDVYRICDIVRAAHSLSIILGPSLDQDLEHLDSGLQGKSEWMFEWGQRLWTVPEALLCPSEHRIAIYTVPSLEPETIAKRNLAVRVWSDADALRQLIDHYEASLQLTQLELISIALECLQRRQTEQRNKGDVAYVLMGLLRLRPKIVKSDSDFQAFARLSLANDSDKILERIICLRNVDPDSPWHDMKDRWEARLWHIDPVYQVAGVVTNNAVVIVDAPGTQIDWDSLRMVKSAAINGRGTYRRHYMNFTIGLTFTMSFMIPFIQFFMRPLMRSLSHRSEGGNSVNDKLYLIILGVFLIVFLVAGIPLPYLLAWSLRSERSDTQARLFGIEGFPDLGEVEASIFGLNAHRLRWNSETQRDQHRDDGRRDFTIIDTLTCTATPLRASRPPTLLFVGGRERGKLRALLCSYDSRAGAFVKGTVVRMESSLLRRMPRLDRFNFSVEPKIIEATSSSRQSEESDIIDIPDIPEFRSLEPV